MTKHKDVVPLEIVLRSHQAIKITFHETDGEFQIHYDTKEHPGSLVVKETSGCEGSVKGDASAILYQDDFISEEEELNQVEASLEDIAILHPKDFKSKEKFLQVFTRKSSGDEGKVLNVDLIFLLPRYKLEDIIKLEGLVIDANDYARQGISAELDESWREKLAEVVIEALGLKKL
jgi:hypothetical protein